MTLTPYYNDGRFTLYRGEALAVLASLDDGSVDVVLTDPPYSSGGMVRSDRTQSTKTKYLGESGRDLADFSGDNRDSRAYGYWSALWMAEALRATSPGGVLAVFTDWRQLPTTSDAVQAGGWVWRGIVPWWKPSGRPVQGRGGNQCEYVVWATAGPRPLGALGGKALPGFYQANAPRHREHQTQKPLDVMRDLVQIANPGEVVLDPFMGSGTTGVATALEGRQFIGVEKVPGFCTVAERRITEALGHAVDLGPQAALEFPAPRSNL